MIIGIDARVLSRKLTGIGYYLKNMLNSLLEIDSSNSYILFSDREIPFFGEFDNVTKIVTRGLSIPGTLWLHTKGLSAIKKQGLDIYWGPANVIPFGLPKILKIVTVHDLVWHLFPSTMSWYNKLISKILCKSSIEKSDLVLAVSETTSQDTKKSFKPKKVVVARNGVSNKFHKINIEQKEIQNLINKLNISKNYILSVCTLEPRKNLTTLLKAFETYCSKYSPDDDLELIIVGASGWKNSNIRSAVEGSSSKDRIRFLGYVSDEELPLIYKGAKAFISTSIYEGFGLPLAESMAIGTPVICSAIKIYDEVTGDSAYKFSPLLVEEIAKGINQVLTDTELRERLISSGLERIKIFSWENSAKILLGALKDLNNVKSI